MLWENLRQAGVAAGEIIHAGDQVQQLINGFAKAGHGHDPMVDDTEKLMVKLELQFSEARKAVACGAEAVTFLRGYMMGLQHRRQV